MDEIQQMLYDAVKEIQSTKRSNGQIPSLATMDEIFNIIKPEIIEALRDLCRTKSLKCHETVNGKIMFDVIGNRS